MTTTTTERDASLSAAYVGVAVAGGLLLGVSSMLSVSRAVGSVALGVVLALANLWVIERFVRIYLQDGRIRLTFASLAKVLVCCGLLTLLVRGGAVDVAPVLVGFGALPLGVIVGGAWPSSRAREGS